MQKRKKIVIIGANFAGLSLALKLPTKYQVIIIDPTPYFEWTPNIHEILSGVKISDRLQISRKEVIHKKKHQFLLDRVVVIEQENKQVKLESGNALAYDVCVIATGGEDATYGVKGVKENAYLFRQANQIAKIREEIEALMQDQKSISVAIIGAGISGVEALGELLRVYKHHSRLQIHLIEQANQLLPGFPQSIDADIRHHCRFLPVHFYTGEQVKSINKNSVSFSSGVRISAQLILWCAGVKLPTFLVESSIGQPHQWLPIDPTLQTLENPDLFAIGDVSDFPNPLKKQAYYAMEMGEHLAENIQRYLQNRVLQPFKPSKKPMIVSFGDIETYLVAGERVVASKAFALVKEGIYQVYMAKFAQHTTISSWKTGIVNRLQTSIDKLLIPEFNLSSLLRMAPKSRILK